MRILVTGGNGLLGSNLINFLLKDKKNTVFVLDKNQRKNNKNLIFLKKNFTDFNQVKLVLKKYKIKVIFHLGAQTQVLKALQNPYDTLFIVLQIKHMGKQLNLVIEKTLFWAVHFLTMYQKVLLI